jgi:hypothetical protein
MPGLLTPQELVALQQDTDYTNAGIPIWGSRVTSWATMIILIYHTKDMGYIVSDISDLPASTIDQLMQQSDVHGIWYYLPQSIQDVIAERSEQIISIGQAAGQAAATIGQNVATAIGTTIANLLQPLVDTLFPVLILGVAIAVVYLTKKG